LWNPKDWLRGELYYGADLKNYRITTDALQDDGIHFQLMLTKSF
jgi:hypothetical protein